MAVKLYFMTWAPEPSGALYGRFTGITGAPIAFVQFASASDWC